MTEEKLKQYRVTCAELEEITTQLAERETTIAVQSSANAPYSLHTVTQSGLPPDPRTAALLVRQAQLQATKGEIEQFVNQQSGEIRYILEKKFFCGWSNLKIAMKLHYRDEGTIRKKLKKIF